MQARKGFNFENRLTRELANRTNDAVGVYPCGYSGNAGFPLPDLLLMNEFKNYAIEVKTTSRDTFTVQNDDIDQMIKCISNTTTAWFAIRFNNRELLVTRLGKQQLLEDDAWTLRERMVKYTPSCFNPRLGRTDTFIVDKPSTDEWPSAQSGRPNWQVIADLLYLPYEGDTDE